MRLSLVALVATGCGRIAFDPKTSDGPVIIDAGLGPFGTPTPIASIQTTLEEEEATFTADRLELAFRRGALTFNTELWVSKRASTADPWGPPSLITELNSSSDDRTPALSPDGLTMWFTSDRGGNGNIYMSTRPDRSTVWAAPVEVTSLSTVDDESSPMVDTTGIWFNRVLTTDTELWHATFASPTTFNPPQQVDDLVSAGRDGGPRTWAHSTRLVFSSTRATSTFDLYEAARTSVADPWSSIAPITELNMPGVQDWDMWISDDGHYAVFGSTRSGNNDIYEVSR